METTIPITLIYPNPNQPRKQFDPEKLQELAGSIKEYGVLEPIVVTPRGERYLIIAGERRFRASTLAGLSEMPVRVIEADDGWWKNLRSSRTSSGRTSPLSRRPGHIRPSSTAGMSREELAGSSASRHGASTSGRAS